jgi:HPt (histidine-containing phosphotransfer) domain-containing protein
MGSLQAHRELVQCFKETLPHSLRSIEEAYRTQDMDRLFHETHALKGTAAHAQAMELAIAVNTLQHCAGAYEQLSDVCDAYAQFAKEAQRVSRFLEKHPFQTTGDSGGDGKGQFRISWHGLRSSLALLPLPPKRILLLTFGRPAPLWGLSSVLMEREAECRGGKASGADLG